MVVHRGDVEIHRLHVGDRDERKRRGLRGVDSLQIRAAAATDFDPPIVAFRVRSGRDERLARFVTIYARVDRPLPRRRAERAAQEPMAADHFGERRPRAARRAVAAVPGAQRFGERQRNCQLPRAPEATSRVGPLQRMADRPDGQFRNQPGEIRRQTQCVAPARIASSSRASDAVSSEPASSLPLSIAPPRWVADSPAPPAASVVAEANKAGFSRELGSGIGSPDKTGTPLRQFGGQIFSGQRQSRQASSVDGARQVDDERQQPALKVNSGLKVGFCRHKGLPAAFGRREHLGLRGMGDGEVGHGTCYNRGQS